MTHEYVVAVGGWIDPQPSGSDGPASTAIAWAADSILTVGTDKVVRAISRGDSTFLDLEGCVVTALPADLVAASAELRHPVDPAQPNAGLFARFVDAGLLDEQVTLGSGAPADLAFWDVTGSRHVAVLRAGVFADGDPRRGPFSITSP